MRARYPMRAAAKQTKRSAAAALLALVVAACGAEQRPEQARAVEVKDLIAEPSAYDGRRVRFEAFYVGGFEWSVLTDRLAESYPPRPREPSIWVAATPEGECLISDVGVTWGEVAAEGVFRYEEEGGFGRLGVYTMQLDDPRLACP